jgi:hypothetical protein
MPPPKAPFTAGTYIGLIGKVIYLIALFLPWYTLMASVDSGDYATHGWVELVHIDGIRGVQINKLLTGGHIPQGLTYLPIPISWILLCFFIWSIISIFRARTARDRGWKLFRGGIVIIIVFVILYFLITRLPYFIPDDSPNELKNLLDYIVAFPFGGDTRQTFGTYGAVHLIWGLQAGGYMLLLSAIVQLVGGFMEWGNKQGPVGRPAILAAVVTGTAAPAAAVRRAMAARRATEMSPGAAYRRPAGTAAGPSARS